MARAAAVVAVLAGIAVLGLDAQQPAPAPAQQRSPTFRAGVEMVQLDVSVLDRARRPVKGLTATDFTILEDGKPQALATFEAIDIADAVEEPAPWMHQVASDVATNEHVARRVVVIVFDDAFMPFDPMVSRTAKQIARGIVDRLGPDDLAAVTFTDTGRRQNVTADRQRLLAAIESLVPHPGNYAVADAWQNAYRQDRAAMGGTSMGTPPPPCMYRGAFSGQAACIFDTFEIVANALLSAPPGRKTIVFISAGVPFDFGMDGGASFSERDTTRGWQNQSEEVHSIQSIFRTLQAANVNVYPIDPSGLTAAGIVGANLDSLRMFAEMSGGRATLATNAPEEAVPQIFRENSSYYLLGFRTNNPAADGRFRSLEVKVNRRDVEVHTRSGYYAPAPSARGNAASERVGGAAGAEPPGSKLDKALGTTLPGGDLPLGLTVAPFAVAGQSGAALAIAIALREPPVAGRQRVDLVATAIDTECPDCKRHETHRQTVELRLQPGAQVGASFEVLSKLIVPPGRYNVRVAAAAGDRTGNVFTDIEVPNFLKDRLSASGLVIGSTMPVLTAQKALLADVIPIVPIAAREFSARSRLTAFLRLYQGASKSLGGVRLNTMILDEGNRKNLDQTAFIESAQFSKNHSADYRLDLPLAKLEAGQHLLTIEAHLGDVVIRRDARFLVR